MSKSIKAATLTPKGAKIDQGIDPNPEQGYRGRDPNPEKVSKWIKAATLIQKRC